MGLQLLEREKTVLKGEKDVQPDFTGKEYLLVQNQAGDPGTGFGIGQRMMVIPQIETAAGCDGLKLMIR